jgi:hypothetical protein
LDFLQARCDHPQRGCEHHRLRKDSGGASTHTREAHGGIQCTQAAAAQWLSPPGSPRPERICTPIARHGVPQVLRRDRALPGYLEAASDIFCRITDHARLEGLPSARLSVDRCACLCLPGRSSSVELGRLSSDLRVGACWGGDGL